MRLWTRCWSFFSIWTRQKSSLKARFSSAQAATVQLPFRRIIRVPILCRCLKRLSITLTRRRGDETGPLQVLVSAIDYNDYVGRIGIGRVERGEIHQNQDVMVADYHETKPPYRGRIVSLNQIEGLKRVPADSAKVGDIIIFSGIENITIGDTLCAMNTVEPLPFVKISEPTVEMTFSVNDSPFAGRDGKFVTSRQIRDRLFRELLKDVSLRVTETDNADSLKVAGRGEMHLSILIENMRREGYEFSVNPPRVLMKTIDGKQCEPIERLLIDVPENCVGSVMEKLGSRKGELVQMAPQGSRMRLEFLIPSRRLFGYRSEFLTDTKGEGIMNAIFDSYQPYKGRNCPPFKRLPHFV